MVKSRVSAWERTCTTGLAGVGVGRRPFQAGLALLLLRGFHGGRHVVFVFFFVNGIEIIIELAVQPVIAAVVLADLHHFAGAGHGDRVDRRLERAGRSVAQQGDAVPADAVEAQAAHPFREIQGDFVPAVLGDLIGEIPFLFLLGRHCRWSPVQKWCRRWRPCR